ncbi:16S rRNA (guanine(966)-N(2))-methyltransferase RsmD [Paenibacillus protaetiae]|uniref:16S rRNA (Guanine(966)-N(2))-methyltransferase RsmD n=1 Tax=Paenibacillus protaetiae TaxID=2509456 RepID=A0A4P6ERA0_9BACL|nr:16S rRNA (guanine(966)-N(2))-methyltransferase RsmD [Paenibacillus protaetiae]QAY65560.1 16S rRNA (guanine(966)-N(2))-methyltransferase RsmD [Paenibacillus protaetiae]
MRVIAGAAKGRPLKAVPGMNTRPTTDKVKEAIFSMIGPYFEGGYALDLFAGTGGLGIEAWSRGIERVIFIDKEKISIDVVRANVQAAGMSDFAQIFRNDAERALKALSKRGVRFRLVFLDPPYRIVSMDELMGEMIALDLLEDQAIIVVEHDAAHEYPEHIEGFTRLRAAKYGDTAVSVYRHQEDSENGGEETDA